MLVFEFFDHFLRRNAEGLFQKGDQYCDNHGARSKEDHNRNSFPFTEGDDLRHCHWREVGRQTDELNSNPTYLIGEKFRLLHIEEAVSDHCSESEDGETYSLQDLGLC